MTPLLIYTAIGFAFGLLFGSFLNVCISRLPKGESVIHPRSRCPQCRAPIRWYDNIPILSFLLLRARCRKCKVSIPLRYPLIELATGLWFAIVLFRCFAGSLGSLYAQVSMMQYIQLSLAGLSLAVLGFLLIGLIVMDWKTHLLPDAFTLTGIVIGFVLTCSRTLFLGPTEGQVILSNHHIQLTSPGGVVDRGNVFLTGPEAMIGSRVVAILTAACLLLLIRWIYGRVRHREGLGLGDVKLLAMIAAFLGFESALLALFLGVLIASAYAIFLLARHRANAATRLPFGSFLAIGGLAAALFGARLITSYTALLR